MADETTTTEPRENARKVREGLVTSNAMDKTAVVTVATRKPHPRYRKTMARTTTHFTTSPRLTAAPGMASLTVATKMSPIEA